MDVSLTPELEAFVHSQVKSGKYASATDVILAGIRLLEEREHIYKGRFEELRREVLVGVEQLDRGEVMDGEVVFQQLREKLQQRHTQAGQ
jgi:antitoxin ParD1/3/4